MDAFYEKIKNVKVDKADPKKILLSIGIDEAFKYLISNYENLIQISAMNGDNVAYLQIFKKSFKLRETMDLSTLLTPTDKMIDDLSEFELTTLEQKLVEHFSPFEIELLDYDHAYVLTVSW